MSSFIISVHPPWIGCCTPEYSVKFKDLQMWSAVGVENFNWSVLLGSFVNALVIAGIQTAYVHTSPAFIIHREFKAEEPPPYVQELFLLILLRTLPSTSYCSD